MNIPRSPNHRLIIVLAVGLAGIFGLVSPVLVLSEEEQVPEATHTGAPVVPLERAEEADDAGDAEVPANFQPDGPSETADTSDQALDESVPLPREGLSGVLASVLDANTIVGFYGNPNSTRMGILGEQSIEATADLLAEQAAPFDTLNGDRGVVQAFHLIYATVWPDANLGRLSSRIVHRYIDYAKEHGQIVILDHQLGRHGVEESLAEMLPYLSAGPVHLAIDPEWRTLQPGREIGLVWAAEINAAQQMMQEYLDHAGIRERRMLIVHQFKPKMIQERDLVRGNFPNVDLVLNADGFGSPQLKLSSWRLNASADNFPYKGFKLFYPKDWKDLGFDNPLMSPADVLNLYPQPVYINYQ